MQLVLKRNQRAAMLGGKPVFMLEFLAKLTPEEAQNVAKYKLGGTVLYKSHELSGGSGLIGAASWLAYKAIMLTVTVDSLTRGHTMECKDVLELLAVEEHVKQAAEAFQAVLTVSANFGGEEVVEFAAA